MNAIDPGGVAPPELVAEAATSCIEYVRRATGVTLDFSPNTLSVLDHYISTLRPDLSSRPELEPLIARAAGAYFGEMIRERYPSFWRIPSDNVHDWQLCSSAVFFWFNPIGIAYDALHDSTEHQGPRSMFRVAREDRVFLEERLAIIQVPEEEFFLLTTRFEAIEASIESLGARQEQRGYGESEFTEEDYVAEFMGAPLG